MNPVHPPADATSAAASEDVALDRSLLPDWLLEYSTHASKLLDGERLETPVHGRTVYLAETTVPTRFGDFRVYIFQDIIHKGYILALAYGDIKGSDTLYTRMHSSCVTSETLGGCDCDCVQQLEGAMAEKIN